MNINNPTYTIQQVSEITGLSKQVIRKWEERYAIVKPQRLENGYRVYTEENIKKLLRIKNLVNQGHSIKHAALLIEKGEGAVETVEKDGWQNNYDQLNDYVLDLLKEGTQCNELGMNFTLQQAYHEKGLEHFIHSVVIPFLKEVGNRWEKGQWGEYQESLASLTVRDYLVQLRRNFKQREDAPTLFAACLPHEHHEVPILILVLLAMIKGWKTTLVAGSPAVGSIEKIVQKLQPDKVLLSATTTLPFEEDLESILELDKFASQLEKTKFYLGGVGALKYLAKDNPLQHIQLATTIDEVLNS